MSFARIRPVVVKEFRQINRDRRTLAVLVLVPAFLLMMYGYALNLDVAHLPTAVYDADHTPASRHLLDRLFLDGHAEYFVKTHVVDHPAAVDALLLDGRAKVGIVVPAGFGRALAAGRRAEVQVLVDGVNASEAAAAVGFAEMVVQQHGAAVRPGGAGGAVLPIDYRPRVWYNPELKSVFFLIPGLIAFILMIITVVATSLSVVRERERGSIEQLMVSPLRPVELILGKLMPYALISLVSAALVVAASAALFAMPIRGSYGLLLLATVIFIVGALGMGLVISTVARTQETACFLATMATLLPTFILSGFVFPISNMPAVIQAVTYFIPARYFLIILRGIMLKGVGLAAFWDQLLLLTAFGLLMLAVGTLRMRRLMG